VPLIKVGGFLNNLIPIVFLGPPAFALAAADLFDGPCSNAGWRRAAFGGFLTIATLYLVERRYSVAPWIPTDAQRQQVRALNAFVASLEGGVVIPSHPFLARRHDPNAEQILAWGYAELYFAHADRSASVLADIERIGPKWVILTDGEEWIADRIRGRYQLQCRVEPPYAAFIVPFSAVHFVYRAMPAVGLAPSPKAAAPTVVPACAVAG
jgi:hypothetical protein